MKKNRKKSELTPVDYLAQKMDISKIPQEILNNLPSVESMKAHDNPKAGDVIYSYSSKEDFIASLNK